MAHTVEEYKTPTFSSTAKEDTATRHFQVTLDSYSLGPRTAVRAVMSQFGIRAGAMYIYRNEVAPGCRAKRIGPARGNPGKRNLYHVDVEYSSTTPPEMEEPENPIDMTTKWGPAGTRTIQKVVFQDHHGKPFVNSIGDPLNEGISIDQNVAFIRARRNVIEPNYEWLSQFPNTWNANDYLGRDEKTVKISSLEYSEKKWQGDTFYWEFTGEFEIYPEEQFLELPNLGWRANFVNDVGDIGLGEQVGDIEASVIHDGATSRGAAGTQLSENIGVPLTAPALIQVDNGFLAARDFLMMDQAPQHANTILKFDLKTTMAFEDLGF